MNKTIKSPWAIVSTSNGITTVTLKGENKYVPVTASLDSIVKNATITIDDAGFLTVEGEGLQWEYNNNSHVISDSAVSRYRKEYVTPVTMFHFPWKPAITRQWLDRGWVMLNDCIPYVMYTRRWTVCTGTNNVIAG